MSETPAEYTAPPQGWECSETDQHFRIDGPGLAFVCQFPTQMIKAGNPECRYWHLGSFGLIHDLATGWEIVQSTEKSSLTAKIPDAVGQWLVGKIEGSLRCSTCHRRLPRERLHQPLDENERPILVCSDCMQVGINNQFKPIEDQSPLNSHLQ